MCSSNLPVAGSLISLAMSNDEEPVTMTCVSIFRSPIIFRVSPMFFTRWASSMNTMSYADNSIFSSVEVLPSRSITSSMLSQFRKRTFWRSLCSRESSVVLPTCLAPSMTMTFFRRKSAMILSSRILCIMGWQFLQI